MHVGRYVHIIRVNSSRKLSCLNLFVALLRRWASLLNVNEHELTLGGHVASTYNWIYEYKVPTTAAGKQLS